ncbi:hypothetical protein PoMZ_13694 [Pyricularia oryzae]|uniref:Uncharacterized protein n=1 Tax=Pyricularia oryzae TaxID=318829 RepID=A0A4P7NW38_PYROR|nr:hypothetical protein PoMZ_13694 [Pyricularia oryzae]
MQTHNQAASGATPISSSILGGVTGYRNQMVSNLETKQNDILSALETALLTQQKLLEEDNEQKGETEPVRKSLRSSERSIEYTGLASSKSSRSRRNLHRGLGESPLMK